MSLTMNVKQSQYKSTQTIALYFCSDYKKFKNVTELNAYNNLISNLKQSTLLQVIKLSLNSITVICLIFQILVQNAILN